ncbi:helix-turn-helix transcriptional regulator [Allosaccharopolyspora coralli]|uniref:Helix-turn-helix transcriptional regulator n=1 Tax=Allosaccharopolyspora coralli TaxID=2665642 RepID=A0A5Q3Q3H5_9PSEU|nr:helix-turn-helix transcriptional regulator [Allosaccharopolyspora coralli]QGK68370.1 helix-turn-helix transcriptional regulator [Allosaccharopolyspora coralli]
MDHRTAPQRDVPSGASPALMRQAVANDPNAAIQVAIQGAGGYGKTALLVALAGIYRDAGVTVVNGAAQRLDTVSEDVAVVVDDAHRATDRTLHELAELARRPSARLFVTYRPWPRRPALTALVEELGRSRPPLLLGALGPAEVARHARNVLGESVHADSVERLLARTGGVPRLVTRVLAGVRGGGAGRLPASVLDQFQHDMEQLGEHGRACLTAMAAGAAAHPELLAPLLDLDHSEVADGLNAVRAGGLTDQSDALLPVAREAAAALTPLDRRLAVLRRMVETAVQRGRPVLDLVRPLLDRDVAPVAGPLMAEAFEQAGDEAMQAAPAIAGRCYRAAVEAGARPERLTARRARAAAETVAFDDALRLADEVLVGESTSDRGLGAQVAATVLAHRGLLRRSAALCEWSTRGARWPGDQAFAVVGLLGTGRPADAKELLNQREDGPPTSLSGATAELASGMQESVAGSAVTSVSTLARSASLAEPAGKSVLLPDSPAAVAAIVAMHCGEFDAAESVLSRGIEAGTGGSLLVNRQRLLLAWVALVRGDTVTARARWDLIPDGACEQPRDRLLATALEAGIASRDNHIPALNAVRGRIRQVVAEHHVDLFTLLPLGELVMAAARLRDHEWLEPHRRDAFTLLDDLDSPPLWTGLLAWRCLHASMVLDDLDAVRHYADVLDATAQHNPMASAMSVGAATWVRVLAGKVDEPEVSEAARGLHAAGLVADAAQLAGQAALRTTDRQAMLSLLERARTLQGKPTRPRAVGGAGAGDEAVLSAREKEVAELVVAGHTYKQVGQKLFISAKTVEHHIGRMKQRLGCAGREELLQRLRDLLT